MCRLRWFFGDGLFRDGPFAIDRFPIQESKDDRPRISGDVISFENNAGSRIRKYNPRSLRAQYVVFITNIYEYGEEERPGSSREYQMSTGPAGSCWMGVRGPRIYSARHMGHIHGRVIKGICCVHRIEEAQCQ